MFRILIITFLAMLLAVGCNNIPASESEKDLKTVTEITTVLESWNDHAYECNFHKNDPFNPDVTLGQLYYGDNFARDIARMQAFNAEDMDWKKYPVEGTEDMKYIFYDDEGDDFE